ncbi:MAG: hypothetical protein II180_01045 [Proteobacteria bacterium]|nr:hypothetical protein [Pseudomonadota bacterium]
MMRFSAKLMVALMTASMAFGVVGCKGEPPAEPNPVGASETVSNGLKVEIVSLELAKPDFIDMNGKAARPVKEHAEVAVLRVKVKNDSGQELAYSPRHFEQNPKDRVQLCTKPSMEDGSRVNVKAIAFNTSNPYHTARQYTETSVKIPAGGEIIDEYLFEPPKTAGDQLVALFPGSMFGVTKNVLYFYVPNITKAPDTKPATLGTPNNIDGMEVKVTEVMKKHAELEPSSKPTTPLKYAYAYTKDPVMAVSVSITNKSKEERSYNPSHGTKIAGINMLFANSPQKRVMLDNTVHAKGQVTGKIAIKPGMSISDVYLFEAPSSSGALNFEISGHIFSVSGLYRFALNYDDINVAEPNLEPYKDAAGEEGEDAEGDPAEEGAAEEAAADDAAADGAAADGAAE